MSPTPPATAATATAAAAIPPPPCRGRGRRRHAAADTAATAADAKPPPRRLPRSPSRPPLFLTPEVWDVIAGAADGDMTVPDSVGNPAFRIPAVGSGVIYHPFKHASPAARGPHVPQNHFCCVHAVDLLADSTTHDLFADITLGRDLPKPHPPPAAAPHHPIRFLSKALSESDVAKHRIFVGRGGDRLFGKFRPNKCLMMRDVFGEVYMVGRNAHTLINDGWLPFIRGKEVQKGDRVYFIQSGRGKEKEWLVGIRKTCTAEEVAMTSLADVRKVVDDLLADKLVKVRLYMGRSEKILTPQDEVGQHMVITAYSKVSLLPQPSKQDSDDELEYADANSGVLESPSISSMKSTTNVDLGSDSSDPQQHGESEVGISGIGYIWSGCEGGHEDEWRHSIAPISAEKLLELSSITHADPITSNPDSGSVPASGEIPDPDNIVPDDGDAENHYRDSADFEKEVEATFHRALLGENLDNVILEINALRLSYVKSQSDSAGALFYSVLKSALAAPYSSNKELYKNTENTILKWKDLLKNYLKTIDEEFEVILKFEEMCLETALEFAPLFSMVLNSLYEKDIISEDAILTWAQEKEGADESDKIFVKQLQDFITWLKEASEEDDEDEDEN